MVLSKWANPGFISSLESLIEKWDDKCPSNLAHFQWKFLLLIVKSTLKDALFQERPTYATHDGKQHSPIGQVIESVVMTNVVKMLQFHCPETDKEKSTELSSLSEFIDEHDQG